MCNIFITLFWLIRWFNARTPDMLQYILRIKFAYYLYVFEMRKFFCVVWCILKTLHSLNWYLWSINSKKFSCRPHKILTKHQNDWMDIKQMHNSTCMPTASYIWCIFIFFFFLFWQQNNKKNQSQNFNLQSFRIFNIPISRRGFDDRLVTFLFGHWI